MKKDEEYGHFVIGKGWVGKPKPSLMKRLIQEGIERDPERTRATVIDAIKNGAEIEL